jgi:uncharacterized protein (DUF1697 family)
MTPATSKQNFLALLRGINVGGKNKLPMKDLALLFEQAGCSDVRTFIQSGNVIFHANRGGIAGLSDRVTQRIEERFGYRIPIVLRTAEEIGATIRNNPFPATGAQEKMLHVYFLATQPDAHAVEALDPQRSLPDAFLVRGKEVYLQLPNGMARTKLTNAYFDSRLSTISTARSWNTVLQLCELMR